MNDARINELKRLMRSLPKASVTPFDKEDGYGAGPSDEEFMLDRTMRSIVMIADGAIQRLLALGWNRKSVNLEIDESDPLPCWVTLRRKRVYEVKLVRYDDGRIVVQGEWISGPPSPGIIDKFMGH